MKQKQTDFGIMIKQPKQDYKISFLNDKRDIVAFLDWNNGNKIKFSGNADEAAKKFFTAFSYLFEEAIARREEEVKREMIELYKPILKVTELLYTNQTLPPDLLKKAYKNMDLLSGKGES